jgi:outer membrane protein OmpA-like peptidoglycan-associated protein
MINVCRHISIRLLLAIFALWLASVTVNVLAQATEIPPKAAKNFEKAAAAFDAGDYDQCEKELLRALDEAPDFVEPYILMGDLKLETGQAEKAVDWYRKALQLNPKKAYVIQNILGNTLFDLQRYPEAVQSYSLLLEDPTAPSDLKSLIRSKAGLAGARAELIANPVPFEPENLGPMVNSPFDEYINSIRADEKGIFFTRREKAPAGSLREFTETLYEASRNHDGWDTARVLDYPPGTSGDAGAICVSPDGTMVFFTACFRRDSQGSCDLYYAKKTDGSWSQAVNMGVRVNSDHWDAQPSISPDGKTLYFASNRKGGYGSADIWKSELTEAGTWGAAVNLGPVINTAIADMAPFIHFDNTTLYFASAGHPGLGGTDLFKSRRSGNAWRTPENLGYPVNGPGDELAVVVEPAGEKGYLSIDRDDTHGGFDIYSFRLGNESRPIPVSYLQGRVFDRKTGKPLQARIDLTDIQIDSLILSTISDPGNGSYLACLPAFRDYALNVAAPGYLFHSAHLPLASLATRSNPETRDIYLDPIETGNTLTLRNIFFETGRYDLVSTSFPELDKLSGFLTDNPGLRIQVVGHTDNQGSEEDNLVLSRNRAEAVVAYLAQKGIPRERMDHEGYGESRPVASNEDENGRAQNRRTEIRLLGTGK